MTTATTMASPRPWARWLVGLVVLVAAVILGAGVGVAATLDAGHATFHVLFSLIGLAPAVVIAIVRPRGGSVATPALLGFLVLAATQLVEAIGALGYGADGYDRVNGLVAFHDLGLVIAPIGLLAGASGLAIAAAKLVAQRTRRPVLAFVVAIAVVAPLSYVILKLIGVEI